MACFRGQVQAEADPAILIIGKAKRPEGKCFPYLMTDALVIGDPFPDKIEASLVQVGQMTALMDPQQHGAYQVEGTFPHIAAGERIRPHGSLFRSQGNRRVGCDDRITPVVFIVAGRLERVEGKHGIIHAQSSAGTVLDDQIRIAAEGVGEPGQISAIVGKKTLTGALTVAGGSDPGFDIVIHLDIAGAVLFNEPAYDTIGVFPYFRVGEVQLITAAIDDPPAMAGEEPAVRKSGSKRTVDTHHLQLEPEPGDHALAADIVRYLPEAFRETSPAFLPLADTVPPFTIRVPAGIDHIVLAAGFSSTVDHGIFFLSGGIPEQAVHIIVENDRQIPVIGIGTADQAAVPGQHLPRAVRESSAAGESPDCSDGNGNGSKAHTTLQCGPPVGLMFGGTGQLQIQVTIMIGDLPVPGSIVLDLPEQRTAAGAALQRAHGQVFLRGPVARIRDIDILRTAPQPLRLGLSHAKIRQ